MKIESSTFLVTGGCSGLGAGCVAWLAAAGGNVVAADLRVPPQSANANDHVLHQQMDVTSEADVRACLAVIKQRFGTLHGVVNCAGILAASRVVGRDGPHDLDLFRRVIEVNLIGTFNVVRLSAAAMSENEPNADGERGVIVNTASISAYEGQIGQAAYSASKGGVAAMTLPLARDLARQAIRVVSIAPGVFSTPMIDAAPEKVQQSLRQQTIFPERLGQPDDFARLVQQIIENPMLNGTTIRIDGAMRMGP